MKNQVPTFLRYLLPSLGDILWIGAFLGVIGLGPRMMNIDGDLGRHITIGRVILEQRHVPLADLFSHTMNGQPVTPHEWLSQVIFALAHNFMGLDGVILVCGLVIGTSFWLVYRCAREASGEVLAAVFVAVLAMAAASLHWLARPHVFTFLMLALWVAVLEIMRRGKPQKWWLLPLIMLPWANLHGAFIAGFVTWALYGVGLGWDVLFRRFSEGEELPGRFWRSFFLGGIVSLLVTLLNPSGLDLWKTSVGYVGSRYLVGHTAEYLPPNFHDASTWPFLLMIGIFAVVMGLQSKRYQAAHVIPAAAWLVMSLYSTRNIPLFAIIAAPLIAEGVGGWLASYQHRLGLLERFFAMDQRLLQMDLSLRGIVWPVVIFALALGGLSTGANLDFQQQGNRFDPQVFPVEAVDWLEANPQKGPVFNYFPWGGYLLYRMWPEQTVFIDGQTDFYGEALTRQYQTVLILQPSWEDVLDEYNVQWVIMPTDEALSGVLRERTEWQNVYEDGTAVIFSRGSR